MTTERKGAVTGHRVGLPAAHQRALFGIALLLAIAGSSPLLGQPTAFDYAPGKVTVKAAALSLGASGDNPNLGVGAGVMEGLRRASFKPRRWDITNPRGTSGVGAYVPEGAPAYWEVVLPLGVHTDLSGYDLLYLCTSNLQTLDAFQVDSLLEAVNEGAVLWIDSALPTATGAAGTGTPWQDAPFFAVLTAGGLSVAAADVPTHALLTRPYRIGPEHLPWLGVMATWDEIDASTNLANLQPLLRPAPAGPVLVAAGRYGSGGFLITGGNVGAEIAAWTAAGVPDPPLAQAIDVLFGYNVIAWATGWTQSRQSARGAGASSGEVRVDLDVKWQSADVGGVAASPVIDDAGRAFVLSYGPTPTVYCFDADPARDLDGDARADDGFADYTGAGSADLVWSLALPGNETPRSTSPTAATALIGGAPTDVVLVSTVDGNGTLGHVRCLDAATGAMLWLRDSGAYNANGEVASLSTPVVHNAYVYVLSSEHDGPAGDPNATYGRVHCFDLATGGDAVNGFWWVYPDPARAPGNATAAAQYQNALPPVDDPAWVADNNRPLLPPIPTPTPSVGNAARFRGSGTATPPAIPTGFDPHLDAVIYFGTPAARTLSGGVPVTSPWGAEYALVPTPVNGANAPAPDPFWRNRCHYRVMLDVPAASDSAVTETLYVYKGVAGTETSSWAGAGLAAPQTSDGAAPPATPPPGFPPREYAQYAAGDVETFLAAIPGNSAGTSYYDVDAGCRVFVTYNAGPPPSELDFLPGPVLFKRGHQAERDLTLAAGQLAMSGQRRAGGQSVTEELLAGVLTATLHPDAVLAGSWGEQGRSGAVVGLDPATGEKRWAYDPRTGPGGNAVLGAALPMGPPARVCVEGPPADTGSAMIVAASQPISPFASPDQGNLGRVVALDPRPDLTLRVRVPIPMGHPAPQSVQMTPAPLPAPFDALGFSPVVQLATGLTPLSWDADPMNVPIIDPGCYRVDYANRRIIFPASGAENVRAATVGGAPWSGLELGPVYGRMLIVSFAYDANNPVTPGDLSDDGTVPDADVPPAISAFERQRMVYHAPDLARWEYTPGMIRLRHHPVAWIGGPTALTINLANGVGVAGVTPGEALVTFGGIQWLPTGLLNADTGTFGLTAAPLQRGAELLVSYSGIGAHPAALTTADPDLGAVRSDGGWIPIPNSFDPPERRQVPYGFGRTIAGIAAANDGRTALVGTEGLNLDGSADLSPDATPYSGGYSPAGFEPDRLRTLVALEWDKVTDHVRGRLVPPAYYPPAAPGVPVVSAAPAVEGDTVITGCRTLAACPDNWATPPPSSQSYEGLPGGPPYGFASALSPARTVITDNERIVETVGSVPDWECTGTRTLDAAWANTDAETNAAYPLNVPAIRRPFSRPAKAVRLTREDYLATHITTRGAILPYTVPTFDPEGLFPAGPIPAATEWPPRDSGVGPGNYLVVDSGSNRVVEVDRQGRQVWPLANYPLDPTALYSARRPSDGLGFDFHTHPTNTILDLSGPTDAHRYMAWNATGAMWEMHTVIADPGNYRVVDVTTTFSYDPTTGAVIQTHSVTPVTPPLVRAATGPRRGEFIRLAYTKAQPLFHPLTGEIIGYLCAANNLHELLVIEAGSQRVNPPGADPLPGIGGGTWVLLSWLYEMDTDGDATNDERLIFENIRHAALSPGQDEYGNPYLFLTVVCGQYRGPLGNPANAPGMAFEGAGPACVEFRVGNPAFDPANPATWVLFPSAAGMALPYWSYTEADYHAGPLGHLYTPPGESAGGTRMNRAFAPVCAQRLPGGRHVITNSRGLVDTLTHRTVPTATEAAVFATPPSLAADVFEVDTQYDPAAPNDPMTQVHIIDVHKVIPNPWLEDWTDPINQPSFAQRWH
ncbi:MAG: hypothetical protein FJX74_02900 [Armatimonadetes bacterium]|nr:hypothetical protein [Armatimonadota bacterium]